MRAELKKEVERIHSNTSNYYLRHKPECSYFNWLARMTQFLRYGKKIYPQPSKKEIEAFKEQSGYYKKQERLKEE